MGDPKHEQVVHVRTSSKSRKSVESEPSLVTVLDLLGIDILNCKSQLDIVDCFLAIIPPKFFTMKRVVSLVFLSHHILCHLIFRCIYLLYW